MTPTNETEETHDTAEDLDNQDLHEQVRVGSIRKRSGGTCDTNRDTAEEVASTDGEASPE